MKGRKANFYDSSTILYKSDKKKAIDNVITYGSTSSALNETEKKFIKSITSETDKKFFMDFKIYWRFKSEKEKIHAKNGEYLCSSRYIERFEKKAFGDKAGNYVKKGSRGERKYKEAVNGALEAVAEQIEKDFMAVQFPCHTTHLFKAYNSLVSKVVQPSQ